MLCGSGRHTETDNALTRSEERTSTGKWMSIFFCFSTPYINQHPALSSQPLCLFIRHLKHQRPFGDRATHRLSPIQYPQLHSPLPTQTLRQDSTIHCQTHCLLYCQLHQTKKNALPKSISRAFLTFGVYKTALVIICRVSPDKFQPQSVQSQAHDTKESFHQEKGSP